MSVTPFPEHEKLMAIKPKSQACGEFLDWLRNSRGLVLCEPQDIQQFEGYPYLPASVPTRKLLAEFFEIDEDKLDAEKQQMLDEIRASSARSPL